MSNIADRRSLRTKKALKRVMLELLSKKDISKITVSELSELADIGRGTFYLHYVDPYDLLDKLEDEMLEQITSHTPPLMARWDHDGLLNHLETIWKYIYENKSAFDIMLNHRNGGRFMEKFRRYCEIGAFAGHRQDLQEDYEQQYNITYVISGSLGIFLKWMEDGAPIPPDQLARIVRTMITGK